MQVRAEIQFPRDIGRYRECVVDVHLVVSGEVTETVDEYVVVLDRGLDLQTKEEVDAAEDALADAYIAQRDALLCRGCEIQLDPTEKVFCPDCRRVEHVAEMRGYGDWARDMGKDS